MRLNQYISHCGIASRRRADVLIEEGRVKVNGRSVRTLGVQVDPSRDVVMVAGVRCVLAPDHVYIALNKPTGYVCTHARYSGEHSVFELLPRQYQPFKIAGRLDKDSEGLTLLSDDGDFVYQLTHPKFRHEKEYLVELHRTVSQDDVSRLRRGVRMMEGVAKFDTISLVRERTYSVVIHQGWKRQIRRMFETLGYPVERLTRVRVSKLQLADLPSGQFRQIERSQVL